jgi:hypothetical protein
VEVDDDRLHWRFSLVVAVVLALPNVGVIGVWGYTVVNEWFLYTRESIRVYSLTIFGGGLASLFGGAVSGAVGLCAREHRTRRAWLASFAVNGVGLGTNLWGFVVYMAPGI